MRAGSILIFVAIVVLLSGCSGGPRHATLPPGTPSPTAFLPVGPSPRPRDSSLGPDRVATMAAHLADASPVDPPAEMTSLGNALLVGVNQRRIDAGLPPLKTNAELTEIAQLRAEDMVVRDYFGHTDPVSGAALVEPLIRSAGFTGRVAENIYATNAPRPTLVDQVVTAWFNSPSHRTSLLDPELRFTGVGLAGDGSWWKICQVFAQRGPG